MSLTDTVAEISLIADHSRLAAGLRVAAGQLKDFAGGAARSMASLSLAPGDAKKGHSWATHAVGQVAGNLAMRGIDLMVEQGKKIFDFNEALVRFGISSRLAGQQLDAVGRAARKTSTDIGVDAGEALAAGRAYMDLAGSSSFTIEKMNILARAAQASGSATTDLAGLMYQLTRTMHVADDQMEDTIGGLINQAKDGAIEARQMAAEFAGILPLFARFGVTGREGAIQAGAMFQVMRDGANSASEAGTMMQRVYAGIQSYAPRFEKAGIQVYEKERDKLGRKVLLPFATIFKGIQNSEAMKDPAAIKKLFGRTEGWRGMLLGDEASRSFGKTDEAIDSTISRLDALIEAGRANGVVMQDLGTYTTSAGGKMSIAIERIKNEFADALTPERIDQIVAGIESMTEAVGPLLSAVSAAADAFMAMAGQSKAVGMMNSIVERTDAEEEDRKKYAQAALTGQRVPVGLRDRVISAEARRNAENLARYQLLNSENGQAPTDAGIKRAIRYAKSGMGPNAKSTPESSAGMWYLEQRKGQISDSRYKRLEAELEAERKKAAAETVQQLSPVVDAWIKRLTDALGGGKPVVVAVDGNPIAKANGNADGRRRR